jgi:hypothetical protein
VEQQPRQPQTPPAAPPPPAPRQNENPPSFNGNPYSNDDLDIPTFLRKR